MGNLETALDKNGNRVVILPEIIFSKKQNIDWNEVEKYYSIYTGCLVVNCTGKGKMYLYDLVDIKKEASNPLRTNK